MQTRARLRLSLTPAVLRYLFQTLISFFDIGGQDMKCLQVKDGVIKHIMLNEACSARPLIILVRTP